MRVPIDDWLHDPLPPFAEDVLSEAALRDTGYFDPGGVAALARRHRAGERQLGYVLSAVIGVQIWDRLFRRSEFARGVP